MQNSNKSSLSFVLMILAVCGIAALLVYYNFSGNVLPHEKKAESNASEAGESEKSIELSDTQLKSVKVESAVEHEFAIEREAVGNIDFNEDLSVQVFPPYQGKIITPFVELGDTVKKGELLYTIDSPDLIQAESSLIAAAGVSDLTTKALKRAKELFAIKGLAQKDLDQATSDQQSAEGALKAARAAVRIFGKTEAEIDHIVAKRQIDPALAVTSPISGQITSRNAQPGLFVQSGSPPAPYAVADTSTMLMIANVAESESPALHLGQKVKVMVMAFPERVFEGRISTIGATVDPATHRVMIRSKIADPRHELRSGMLANFVIRTGDPVRVTAVPLGGVVREGDGTMTVWVTTDRHHFSKRVVRIGLQENGYDQITEGLQLGELVATEGALFIDNALTAASQ